MQHAQGPPPTSQSSRALRSQAKLQLRNPRSQVHQEQWVRPEPPEQRNDSWPAGRKRQRQDPTRLACDTSASQLGDRPDDHWPASGRADRTCGRQGLQSPLTSQEKERERESAAMPSRVVRQDYVSTFKRMNYYELASAPAVLGECPRRASPAGVRNIRIR